MKEHGHAVAGRAEKSRNHDSAPISMDDVSTRYCGQWVLLQVTAFDRENLATQGHVVAHGSRQQVDAALASIPLGAKEVGGRPYYLFSAGPRARTGEGLRAALAEAAEKDAIGAWRR